ncbi:IclR family transcriptional regulator [Aureimonas mangrovi]|uniref:IclR family transcriptional regulator n=1 Tax=Aureimonas mangrovi TaxID=2758041 RepID=UPI00163D6F73|nr:IclR family transcriptional regulator [Aureimonas mangrovi]
MKSIQAGLRILSLFKDASTPLGVMDVAQAAGLTKSHASRILSALRDTGYLAQDPRTRRYSVGIESFSIGIRFVAESPITRAALPIMRGCSESTGHSVFISVRDGSVCRHILAFEGRHFEDTQWRVGVPLALHATASGKALVAFSPNESATPAAQLELRRLTPKTITDPCQWHGELEMVRGRGWAEARGETVPGLAACAVPIFGYRECLVAAFGIVAPQHALTAASVPATVTELHVAARRLSYTLGARAYPF